MLSTKFTDEAYTAYTLGDMKKASYYFTKAVEASEQQPYAVIDTNALYNSALTSYILGEYDSAKGYYEKCLALGYSFLNSFNISFTSFSFDKGYRKDIKVDFITSIEL